jgi:type VI secretion system protein ImpG
MAREYYQKELTRLRELGREFGERNPNIAPMLIEDGTDPDVERLLEGFAYLTGNIQEKLDDQYSEIVNTLTEIFFPDYLKPIVSACMVEFSPQPNIGRPLMVSSDTEYAAAPIDGTACHFRSQYNSLLQPFSLTQQKFGNLDDGGVTLTLEFTGLGIQLTAWDEDELSFYVAGNVPNASLLFLLIMRHCEKVSVKSENEAEYFLPEDSLQSEHSFWDKVFLYAKTTGAPNTYFLSQYFNFIQQFL